MSAINPRERLTRLVELAGRDGPEARRALAGELADLLLDWPANYPPAMREPFEALLEKAIHDVDAGQRADLARRFAARQEAPLALLNLLVFDAAPEIKAVIVARNAAEASEGTPVFSLNESALVAAARGAASDDLAAVIASRFQIDAEIAQRILADKSAFLTAALCKGTRASRATFSALALLLFPAAEDEAYRRLAVHDDVPEAGSRALLASWQGQRGERDASPRAA